MRRRDWLAAAAAWSVCAWRPACAQGLPARVAAASDLQFVLPEIAAAFQARSALRVELTFGSSGNVARQIQQGAPLDLFLSADESYVLRLADAGLTRDRGHRYATGHLALVAPAGSTLPLDPSLDGLRQRFADVTRFAIANPELAPYGRAAREALQNLGLWDTWQDKLVLGENVTQATQYVASGAAQAGITSLSLARAPALAGALRHVGLPASLHAPIVQRMVLLRDARPAAADFRLFVLMPEARRIFAAHGFGEPPAGG